LRNAGCKKQTYSTDENRFACRCRRLSRSILQPGHRSRPEPAHLCGADEIRPASPFPPDCRKFSITTIHSMIRIITALIVSAVAMLAASCCCTSDVKPPGLRPLPQFQEIQSAPVPEVHGTK